MTAQEVLAIIFGTGLTLAFLAIVCLVVLYCIKFGFRRERLDIELREKAILALSKYIYPCSWNKDEEGE